MTELEKVAFLKSIGGLLSSLKGQAKGLGNAAGTAFKTKFPKATAFAQNVYSPYKNNKFVRAGVNTSLAAGTGAYFGNQAYQAKLNDANDIIALRQRMYQRMQMQEQQPSGYPTSHTQQNYEG